MNPFYRPQQPNNMFQSFSNMMEQFNKFRSTFQGNPYQKVQELRSSGQMSDEQFNQLSMLAKQFQQMIR